MGYIERTRLSKDPGPDFQMETVRFPFGNFFKPIPVFSIPLLWSAGFQAMHNKLKLHMQSNQIDFFLQFVASWQGNCYLYKPENLIIFSSLFLLFAGRPDVIRAAGFFPALWPPFDDGLSGGNLFFYHLDIHGIGVIGDDFFKRAPAFLRFAQFGIQPPQVKERLVL